jgi:hypothetical protein
MRLRVPPTRLQHAIDRAKRGRPEQLDALIAEQRSSLGRAFRSLRRAMLEIEHAPAALAADATPQLVLDRVAVRIRFAIAELRTKVIEEAERSAD